MHHPMPGRDKFAALEMLLEPAQQDGQHFFVGHLFSHLVRDQQPALAILGGKRDVMADALELSAAQDMGAIRFRGRQEQREFDARGAGIEDEDRVHRLASIL
jgi:hypothetical protein